MSPADTPAAPATRARVWRRRRERLDWVFDLATTMCRRVIAVALLACLATLTWLGAVTMFNLATTRAAAPAGAPVSTPAGTREVVGHVALAAHTAPLPSPAATRCVSAADTDPGFMVTAGPVDLRLGARETASAGCGLGLAARDSDAKHNGKHSNHNNGDNKRDKGRGGGQDWNCLCRDRAPAGWAPWGPAGWTDRAGRTGWPSGWPTTATGSGWPWAPTSGLQPNGYGYNHGQAGSGAVCRPVEPGQLRELPGGTLICAPANPSLSYTPTGW